MRKIGWIVLLAVSFLSHAASFDCTKAKTPQEKAICSSKELSAADDRMAAAYQTVLAAVPSDIAAELRATQRSWIRGMPYACRDNLSSDALTGCLSKYYQARIHALRHIPDLSQISGMIVDIPPSEGGAMKGGSRSIWRSVELSVGWDLVELTPGWDMFQPTEDPWPQAIPDGPDWKAWNTCP